MNRDYYKQIKEMLEQEGMTDIKYYMLINNEGYTFTDKEGRRCDLRHWRNVYGSEVDFWSCEKGLEHIKDKATEIYRNAQA